MSINMKNLRFRHPVRYARMIARARRMADNRYKGRPFAEERAIHNARLSAERLEIQEAWAEANERRIEEEQRGGFNFLLGLLALMTFDSHKERKFAYDGRSFRA